MGKSQESRSHKVALFLSFLLILLLGFSVLNQDRWVEPAIHDLSGTVGYRENPWTLSQDDRVISSDFSLPAFRHLEAGKYYSVKTRMTYDGSKDNSPYGFLHLDHIYCRVLLDGQELFSYMPEDARRIDKARSPGFIYKAFPLPRDCQGKEMEIQLLPLLTANVDYGLPDISFGDYTSTLRTSITRDSPHNLVMLFCAMIGLGALIFSALVLRDSNYREGISIGIFCLLFAFYMVTECRINTFYIGSPYWLYLINYFSLSLLPASLMCFMRERLPKKYQRFWNGVVAATLLLFLIEVVLHFSGIFDLREAVTIIHIIAFAEVGMVIAMMLTMKDRKRKTTLLIQSTFLIAGMLCDILIYHFHWEIGSNDATFTILGVMVFLSIEMLHIWKTSLAIYAQSIRSKLYWQMAYVDELTAAGNRRAYDEEINRILSEKKTYGSMIVVSADVNRLKFVNDHFGHSAGDNLISSAAQVMKEAVKGAGPVFRTGGDEFAIFLYDVTEERYLEMRKTADEKIKKFNEENPYRLSLAVGYVEIRDHDILGAVQQADQKMYEDKANHHITRE